MQQPLRFHLDVLSRFARAVFFCATPREDIFAEDREDVAALFVFAPGPECDPFACAWATGDRCTGWATASVRRGLIALDER